MPQLAPAEPYHEVVAVLLKSCDTPVAECVDISDANMRKYEAIVSKSRANIGKS